MATFLSTVLQIILLGFEIDQIMKQIKASSSNDGMSVFFYFYDSV